jgi:hypothetical protein
VRAFQNSGNLTVSLVFFGNSINEPHSINITEAKKLLYDSLSVFESDAFWIAVGSIGAIVALVFAAWQIRTSRLIAAADFLLKIHDTFYSANMIERRKEIAKIFKDHPNDAKSLDSSHNALEVLDFFEDIGLLVKKKVIPLEFVWSPYYYWILHYWTAAKEYVYWYRKTNHEPTYYDKLEYLYNEVKRFEELTRHEIVEVTPRQLQEFIDEELKL